MAKGRILVVDDESAICELITEVLRISDYDYAVAADGVTALNEIRKNHFDLIVLDVNLPKMDGFTVLEKVRESAPTQPIIMISARTEKNDVTHGLRLGADDYIRKPFSVEELLLRIENQLRRGKNIKREIFSCGPIKLDEERHEVSFTDEKIELSPTEFNLLSLLIQNQNRVFSKEKLLDLVWGVDFQTSTNVVDTYISYLRKKLHKADFEGIKTVRGVGFKLEAK
ncbi:MAG: response regulator transcription factor [Candidatus Nanopelagicaceae bacterium]